MNLDLKFCPVAILVLLKRINSSYHKFGAHMNKKNEKNGLGSIHASTLCKIRKDIQRFGIFHKFLKIHVEVWSYNHFRPSEKD